MMKQTVRWSAACLVASALVACGGGGGGAAVSPPAVPANVAIAAAAVQASNDSASNSTSAFSVLQAAGVPVVSVTPKSGSTAGVTKVNFTVFSGGTVVTGLTTANLAVAMAKLTPASNGRPSYWSSYISGAGQQAATDPAGTLSYNAMGYYTYTLSTDITDPAQTNNVAYEPTKTQRVALELHYTNAAGATVTVNPYFDYSLSSNSSVALCSNNANVAPCSANQSKQVADVSSCNSCHQTLSAHNGAAVSTQMCVMCHNPGTTDSSSGNVLTLSTMVHSIHAGKLLANSTLQGTAQPYVVGSTDYSNVGFPQDLRNCSVCHSASNPLTPQGDNWKTLPAQETCLSCHSSNAGSTWDSQHKVYAPLFGGTTGNSKSLPDSACSTCHVDGAALSTTNVHWSQVVSDSALYQMNILSATLNDTVNHQGRSVTVTYNLSNPQNGNALYNLSGAQFAKLQLVLGYQNVVGQSAASTEYSSFNTGGSSAAVYANSGSNNGANQYSVSIPLPNDSATAVARGSARVVSIGQVVEPAVSVSQGAQRPPLGNGATVNVPVQQASLEFALSGTLQPRRVVVSTTQCNTCHGALGTASGSNTLPNGVHNGAASSVESCAVCHDANSTNSTAMSAYGGFSESYQFKRMIHGIHGGAARSASFNYTAPTPANAFSGASTNYSTAVQWPGVKNAMNCNACHVNNSYQSDRSTLGAVVSKPNGGTDPNQWLVISPKAASCSACHDGGTLTDGTPVAQHMAGNGGFFSPVPAYAASQGALASTPVESCDQCHAVGSQIKPVNTVHGQQ